MPPKPRARGRFWWSNVAYINNLVPWHQGETKECFYHAWYLADDMQASGLSSLAMVAVPFCSPRATPPFHIPGSPYKHTTRERLPPTHTLCIFDFTLLPVRTTHAHTHVGLALLLSPLPVVCFAREERHPISPCPPPPS